jgi:hypothetical protein
MVAPRGSSDSTGVALSGPGMTRLATALPGAKWGVVRTLSGGEPPPPSPLDPQAGTAAAATLTPFPWLLVLRALREEKVVMGVREFVRLQLGTFFTEPPPFDLEAPFSESSSATPLIFILSPGADPVDYLFKLAKAKGKSGGLKIISLGQGQGPLAQQLRTAAATAEGPERRGIWAAYLTSPDMLWS